MGKIFELCLKVLWYAREHESKINEREFADICGNDADFVLAELKEKGFGAYVSGYKSIWDINDDALAKAINYYRQFINNSNHKSMNVDIFISHSSEDKVIVEELINIIRKAYNLHSASIRCTSVSGHKLPLGVDTHSTIREEVNDTKVFVGIITEKSISSTYTMFEFGARWGTGKTFIPIVLDKKGTMLLQGPLEAINASVVKSEEDILQFIEGLKMHLNNELEPASSYMSDVKSLFEKINNH